MAKKVSGDSEDYEGPDFGEYRIDGPSNYSFTGWRKD